jgi:hypothetical protein
MALQQGGEATRFEIKLGIGEDTPRSFFPRRADERDCIAVSGCSMATHRGLGHVEEHGDINTKSCTQFIVTASVS